MRLDGLVALRQRVDRQRDDHAVQRTAAAMFLQQIEEAQPFRGVDIRLALLLDIAAGGVDQNRMLGKEPVAIARAADALQVVGQVDREIEPGLAQRRRLAGRRRPDDDIPRHVAQEFSVCRACAASARP